MFIEQLILEGFKTYPNRTVISGFDSQFNAITGLNGSGKSNILDAIQFLLGSTSKEMLRLSSAGLVQLITNGASISKASVSIKFRCPYKDMRPTGYENCEELLVTRQITKDKVAKFFVNGLSSNLTKVKNLFRSTHLNIENPHFLVKQGRITKIINLKPTELLGMIEETAGTAIYNKTKIDSERMIDKKELKLNSINEILKTSIEPQMNKLNAERQRYTLFKTKESDMKELQQLIQIHEFATKTKTLQAKEYELNSLRDNHETKTALLQQQLSRLNELEKEIQVLRSISTHQVYAEYNEVKKQLQAAENELRHRRKRIESLAAESMVLREEVIGKEEAIERKQQELEWKSKELIQQEKQREEYDELLNEITSSKGDHDAQKLLQKQLAQERTQVVEFKEEIRLMNQKLCQLKGEAETELQNQAEVEQTKAKLNESLQTLDEEISLLKDLTHPQAVEDPQLTSNHLKKLQNERKRILETHYGLRFSYNDPEPNFDRSKIKGKLLMLFKVKERTHEKALEVGVGGKLQNIVVVNEMVSKLVIERETFGKNIAIIPNNKITYKTIRPNVIQEARRIADSMRGFARPAYELIDYDKSIENSIMFGFSNFLVCSDSEIARKIAYDDRLNCKCVTFDGDVLEPGTYTGGFMKMEELLIGQCRQLREIEDDLAQEKNKYAADKQKYNDYLRSCEEYKQRKKDLEDKISRKEKIKQRMANLSLTLKRRNFNEETEAINHRIDSLHSELQEHEKKEKELLSMQKKGGKPIKDQKKQVKILKDKQEVKISELKKVSSLIEVEIDTLSRRIQQVKGNDEKNKEEIAKMEEEAQRLKGQLRLLQKQFDEKEGEKERVEKEQARNESQLKLLVDEESAIRNQCQDNENEILAMKEEIEALEHLLEVTESELKEITDECPWLAAGKTYEIPETFDYKESVKRLKETAVEVDRLRKTVKITIDDHSYEKLVEEYRSLCVKKDTLQKDKMTLLQNMQELDEKRTKTLENCYLVVRDNLSKIFNDLLPGATAHLNLVNEHDVTQGAELQVQFNRVKKELNELSGGQRSLLALSFILALLLYKPSPFYILDEIDSALDLSHTENIGHMISQRFPQSQFLIISLKEGMYQNANVLYKIHFAEGESKVERQVLKKKK